ncbi:hypothetical protein ONS95_014656 [Cadophora gregata]|uniref:uncharacterized protein n=1 Tax=Cadophora gregata TaxID=51156 RepID=UPI0026DACB42|nr:uncharacterized protein ONS95_014656 [Cadophora gregata]KAK0112938.1 hypothetical protein ONS95_014656 [Cadophora gregata]KAK0125062.1 hypothetical protein ONS96_008930 [Cadophora gregata f. sp. sojae]
MDPSEQALLEKQTLLFGNYQVGSNSRGGAVEAIPESPLSATPGFKSNGLLSFSQTSSALQPIKELASFSLRSPKCPQCKGKRFDFTAYFHNPRFFSSPPHELLYLVERSYVLKNRLQSILVTYIVHDLRSDHMMQDVCADIQDWVLQVANLTAEVRGCMGRADGVEGELVAVQAWTEEMANRMAEHLERFNGKKMEVPKGWKKETLSDFRKQWEKVWITCASTCTNH